MANNKSVSFHMEKELQKYTDPAAMNFLACTWYRYMFPYIPADTFILASTMDIPENREIRLSPEEAMQIGLENIKNNPQNVIHFKAPYASKQYEGLDFNFRTDQHELAQAHWGQVAADLHGEQIVQEFKNHIKRSEK